MDEGNSGNSPEDGNNRENSDGNADSQESAGREREEARTRGLLRNSHLLLSVLVSRFVFIFRASLASLCVAVVLLVIGFCFYLQICGFYAV